MVGGWKSEIIEKILISFFLFSFFVWLRVKKWRDGKNEFAQIYSLLLLKDDAQLKQKSDKQPTKKKKKIQSPKFIKKIKIMSRKKKSHLKK